MIYTPCMDTAPPFDQGMGFRTTPAARKALARVVAELKNTPGLRFFGGRPTQEAIINATWLWLDTLDEAELHRIMGEAIPRLESAMRGAGPAAATPEVRESPNLIPPAPKRSRKSSA